MRFYLDKNQIERLAANRDVYYRGEKCYLDGGIASIKFSDERGQIRVTASVLSKRENSIIITLEDIRVIFDNRGILLKYSCSCNSSKIWKGGCMHIIAVLLKIFDHSKEMSALSKSFRASKHLLETLEKQAIGGINGKMDEVSPLKPVELSPIFCVNYAGVVSINLEVGINRMYIVKNVHNFISAVLNEDTVSYGRKLEFKHSISMFEKRSKEFMELILNEHSTMEKIKKILVRSYGGYYVAQNEKEFHITPSAIDKIFDLYHGEEVKADIYERGRVKISLETQHPKINFTLGFDADREKVSNSMPSCFLEAAYNLKMPPVAVSGQKFGYIIFGDPPVMYRTDFEFFNVFQSIFNSFRESESNRIFFDESQYKNLKNFLVLKLKEYNAIDILDETLKELPFLGEDNLVFKAYLDVENKAVTLTYSFVYGDTEIKPPYKDEHDLCSRNIIEEYKFLKRLSLMGFKENSSSPGKMLMNDDNFIFDFYYSENGLKALKEIAQVYVTDNFLSISKKPTKIPKVGLKINAGILEFFVDSGDFTSKELLSVLDSLKLKKKYHKLSNGRFVDLSQGQDADGENTLVKSLAAFDSLIYGLNISGKDFANGLIKAPKYRAVYAGKILEENPLIRSLEVDEALKKLLQDFDSKKIPTITIPSSMESVLRSYQKEGYNWLMTLSYYGFGGVLADDMGLGKTIQVIAVLLKYKQENQERKPSLVVAPTSLIYNWEKEISRFAPEIETITLSGTASKRKKIFDEMSSSPLADVYITTYDILKRDEEEYKEIDFKYIIADEAQNIKNPSTQNSRCIKMLKAEIRFALTGTPIENSLSELWSIFDFVMPGYLFSHTKFSRRYEVPIIKSSDKNAANELKKQISPFIMRRLKSDVLKELPEKVESTLYAEMPEEQKLIYTAFLLKAKGELEETLIEGKFNEKQIEILSMLTRLRQICCHPATFDENYKGGSGKHDITIETVKSSLLSGHRILIFSQFTKMLEILKESLDQEGISYFYLDGKISSKERLKMTEKFNAGENDVFLISLKAGGSGLNLTGADIVIHYDPWWNPAVMDQASDRAHRFGQKRTVQIINIVAKDSIEEKIIALQSKKKGLVDTVIEEGAAFITKLSQNEVIQLFRQ